MSAARCVLALLLTATAAVAHADDLAIRNPADQTDFNRVAQDVTAAFDYRALGAGAPGGLLGFDVSGFASVTPVHDRGAWQRLTGKDTSTLTVGGLNASKGLPGGIDVGAFVAGVAGSGATLYGAQLRYALLQGSLLTPSLSLRGSYTGASGIPDYGYRSYATDITLSQALPLLTPYAGVGYVWGKLTPHDGLHDVSVTRPKGFVGLRLSLFGVVGATAEYQRLGHDNAYSAQLSIGL